MTITRSYAKLPAQDPERAKRFHAEHFGLEPHRELHAGDGPRLHEAAWFPDSEGTLVSIADFART